MEPHSQLTTDIFLLILDMVISIIVVPGTVIIQKRENKSVDNWITERRTVVAVIDLYRQATESITLVFEIKTRLH